jgi:hypothetical protein
LFIKQREVSTDDIAKNLGLKSHSSYELIKKWLESEFGQIENSSKKARTYIRAEKWKQLMNNNEL